MYKGKLKNFIKEQASSRTEKAYYNSKQNAASPIHSKQSKFSHLLRGMQRRETTSSIDERGKQVSKRALITS